MRVPDAIPAAGQKTATPSGFVNKARLSRATRKYATATAMASAIARSNGDHRDHHAL